MAIPQNRSLPVSWVLPGIYVDQGRAGAAPNATNRRVLLLGYKTSAGIGSAGTLFEILSEDDVVQKAGKGSDLHRMYKAFSAQSSSTGASLWAMPLSAPSGTAQTRKIQFLQSPNGAVLGTGNSGAVAAGFVSVWICGYRFDSTISNGDTFETIAADLCTQIQAGQDFLPCTATVSTDTITLTARHTALTSADLPIMISFSSAAMQVSASPGTLTFATTAAANGVATVGITTQSAGISFLSGATAAAITASMIAAINAAVAFPVTSAQPSTPGAVVTLFFVPNRIFNWASAAITTAATTTLTPSWGNSAAGLPSSASPSLSDVLTILEAQPAFKLWLTNFTGAGSYVTASGLTQSGSTSDYSVLGTISSVVEAIGNGQACKGTMVPLCDTRALSTAGSIPVSTSPALTLSPRYFLTWCPASPQQAVESAARCAAIICGRLDYPNFNYAGQALLTDGRTPYLLPHLATYPSDSDVNAAILSYFLTPLRTNGSNQMSIVSGRTTGKPTADLDYRYSFWGVALADDFCRDDLIAAMPAAIQGKNLKRYSPPHTQFTTTEDAIKTAVASRMKAWDALDIFDGADDLTAGLAAEVNIVLPSRIDVRMPKRFAIPAEQVSVFTDLVA